MDSKKLEERIEQLTVELSGAEGMLNEICTLLDLFMPTLWNLPPTMIDKAMLANLDKRKQIVQMQLNMKRNAPPTIVQSLM